MFRRKFSHFLVQFLILNYGPGYYNISLLSMAEGFSKRQDYNEAVRWWIKALHKLEQVRHSSDQLEQSNILS